MILIIKTIDRFGYDPTLLSKGSEKMVMYRCDYCNTEHSKKNKLISKSHQHVNKDCCNSKECIAAKQREISQQNHGSESPFHSKVVQQKVQQTFQTKYGGPSPFSSSEVQRNKKKPVVKERKVNTSISTPHSVDDSGRNELVAWIRSLAVSNVIENDRTVLSNGKELDVWIPERSLAIEYCGTYWHTEQFLSSRTYHSDKRKACLQKGIRLLTIFSDEWNEKQDICKSRILSALGLTLRKFARKCVVREIDSKTSHDFLETHHIQGSVPARARYGLFQNGHLLAVMTFGKPRFSKDEQWELLRYASVGTVLGGASKLFTHFIRRHSPKTVVSYCDLRWGRGDLYRKLGFVLIGETEPGYSYVGSNGKRVSRFLMRKTEIEKQQHGVSEWQICQQKGFYRLWDCGNSKFVWTTKKTS